MVFTLGEFSPSPAINVLVFPTREIDLLETIYQLQMHFFQLHSDGARPLVLCCTSCAMVETLERRKDMRAG